MNRLSLIGFSLLLVAGTGCLQPGKTVQAQTAALEDTIRFTHLTVVGNIVTIRISRIAPGLETFRAGVSDPVEFPEYATFTLSTTADGQPKLVNLPSQTHVMIPLSEAACTDTACSSFTFTMTRKGGTLGDVAHLKATRVSKVTCAISIRDANGTDRPQLNPTFDTGTITSTTVGVQETDRHAFYGNISYVLPTNGYHASISLRSFLGVPSELWLDEVDSSIASDGRAVHIGTTNFTFAADRPTFDPQGKYFDLFGSDVDGRRAQIVCTH
jgi:hypothetical protein